MHRAALLSVSFFFGCTFPALAQTQDSTCRIGKFLGASSPQGAVAIVGMQNNGKPCAISNFGLPEERANPAQSGRITKAPSNGQATFIPPQAIYLPGPGFIGVDEFEYEAWAAGKSGQHHRLRVIVKVTVEQPE